VGDALDLCTLYAIETLRVIEAELERKIWATVDFIIP
jgi:hypothetical protein